MKDSGGLEQSECIMKKAKNIFIHRLEYRMWEKLEMLRVTLKFFVKASGIMDLPSTEVNNNEEK